MRVIWTWTPLARCLICVWKLITPWPVSSFSATNYHLGTLKAKIAKLKSELVNGPGGKSAGTKNAERGFDVTKSGDTRIGLVGFPSVGKSTLLTSLTGTRSEAAAYEFTTLTCIPGTMKCECYGKKRMECIGNGHCRCVFSPWLVWCLVNIMDNAIICNNTLVVDKPNNQQTREQEFKF